MTSVGDNEGEPTQRHLVLRAIVQPMVLLPVLGGLLFGAAGRLDWVMGWAVLIACLAGLGLTNLLVIVHDTGLARERAYIPATVKQWDRKLTQWVNLPTLLMLPVAGLDLRYGWSPTVARSVQLAALAVFLLGYALVIWAMMANRFFSSLVRIQPDRGHVVVSSGPYRYVRHPGYLGFIALALSAPLACGGISSCLYLLRTVLEDRTLQDELQGYRAYAEQVRYRLLPGIW